MTPARKARALMALAILLEVSRTLGLRLSDAYTALGWAVAVVTCYVTSMFVFARALVQVGGLGLLVVGVVALAEGLSLAVVALWA